jgi:hypothetical protein
MRLDTNIGNHEKSQALVGRFRDAMLTQAGLRRDPFDETHYNPLLCTSVPICLNNRLQVSREIDRKLIRLQDSSLIEDEMELRLLNDEVNKLVGLFDQWNYRLKQLGGTREVKELYEQGIEVVQKRGYRYFGKAKELPEAKKAQEDAEQATQADNQLKKQQALLDQVDDFYFGHEPIPESIMKEAEEAEAFFQAEDGPFEFCGTKKIPAGETLLPEFHIPTVEEATKSLIEYKREKVVKKLEAKLKEVE